MFLIDLTAWNLRNVVLRLLIAMVLGGVIGIDRGPRDGEEAPGRMRPYVSARRWS